MITTRSTAPPDTAADRTPEIDSSLGTTVSVSVFDRAVMSSSEPDAVMKMTGMSEVLPEMS